MTVPVQRGPESDGTGRVLGFVAESLRRLEDSVAKLSSDVNTQMSRLPELYVPRREIDRWRDELSVDLGAEESARKADVGRLADRLDEAERQRVAAEQQRITGRRWLIGVLLTVASLLLTLTGLVLANLT